MYRLWVLVLGIVLMFSCMNNPYDPMNIPNDLGIGFTLSKVADSVNTYCFFPMDIKLSLKNKDNIRYIDSIYFFTSSVPNEPKYKLNMSSMTQDFSYMGVGDHRAFLRIYEFNLGGDYRDTIFTVRSGINYYANPINVLMSSATGMSVPLRPIGNIYRDVTWEWDLSRMGMGIIESVGDTSVWVNKVVNDTVFLTQTKTIVIDSTLVQVDDSSSTWSYTKKTWRATAVPVSFQVGNINKI